MIVAALTLLAVALTVSLLLAPLEALGWWAGWFGEEERRQAAAGGESASGTGGAGGRGAPPAGRADGPGPELYVVYLDGIAKAGHVNYRDVRGFLARLQRALPRAVVLGDVLPYSPSRRGLTEGRPLSRFWRRMLDLKLRGRRPVLTFSINARNLLQVLVASDSRYAALYGRAAADAIVEALTAAGYVPHSGVPVALVGYSGGAQVALVATPYLKRRLGAPLSLVSLAGVMADEPGMLELERVLHVESRLDRVPRMGRLAFPGLWGVWPRSYFSRLRRSGRLRVVDPGPMRHNGGGSYLDDEAFIGGRSHQEVTTALVAAFLAEAAAGPEAETRPGAPGAGNAFTSVA